MDDDGERIPITGSSTNRNMIYLMGCEERWFAFYVWIFRERWFRREKTVLYLACTGIPSCCLLLCRTVYGELYHV